MALSYTTGMTLASAADSATNWNLLRLAGSGGGPTFGGLDTTIKVEGTGSISSKVSVANTDACMLLDWYTNTEGGKGASTTVNLTTVGNEIVGFWVQLTTVAAVLAYASGGLYLIISSSTEAATSVPTVYSKWYVGGSDKYAGGWQYFQIDTRKTPSTTVGGGASLSAVRRIGVGLYLNAAPGTIKADNIFVDAIWYGRPKYAVTGDGSATATWALMLANSIAAANNLITDIGGAYQLSCGLRIGNTTQSATTTFVDATGQQFLFKRYKYYSGGDVDAVAYEDIYIIDAVGGASNTSVTVGSVVGTGDDRQGVQGGAFRSPSATLCPFSVDFATDIGDLDAVNLYGLDVVGASGGVLLDDTKTKAISCAFINCGEVNPGTTNNGAEILNCAVIDPQTFSEGTVKNRGLRIPATHNISYVSLITSGAPATQHLAHHPVGGPYSVTYAGLVFFGDYSSGTLWHGEASANDADTITLACTAGTGSNPDATQFNKTGTPAAAVTVSNTVGVTFTGMKDNTEVRVYDSGTGAEIDGIDPATAGTTDNRSFTWSTSAGTVVDYVIHSVAYETIRVNSYMVPSSAASLPIQQRVDRNYANPA